MRPWPKSAYLTILGLLVVFGIALRSEYTQTRQSYRAVGFNDGQIFEREETLHKIEQLVPVPECRQLPSQAAMTEFLSVKAESLYVVVVDGGRVQFCR
jgi:hypothetical protein